MQSQNFGEDFLARLIDVAMDQVLQTAGFAFEQNQKLVGFAYRSHVVPGAAETVGAVPDNAARMTATVALSAAIDNRRHLIGSTRTTLSVSRSRLRRGRAFRVADCSSLRATKSR